MSKVTSITFENFLEHMGKDVEVEITGYQGGMSYPDNNILVGMNENTYYFVSDIGTPDQVYWHWTIEKDADHRNGFHIQVWDKAEYDKFYNR